MYQSYGQDSLFRIEGHLEKIQSGLICLSIYEDEQTIVDSAIITGGRFQFSGINNTPAFATLTLQDRQHDFFPFYLEADTMQILGRGDSLGLLVVKHSGINDDDRLLQQRLKSIYQWEKRNSTNMARALKMKEWQLLDRLEKESREILMKKRKVVGDYVEERPHSMRAAMAILENFRYFVEADQVREVFRHLDQDIRNSKKGKQIQQVIQSLDKTAVGRLMPEIIQQDTSGKSLALSKWKGKWVLINFWASWCGPCRRENPSLKVVYQQYQSKGFTIFNVSLDEDKVKWKEAINADNLPWPQVSELNGWKNTAAEKFYIKAIPYNIFINPKGKIVAKNIFKDDLIALLEKSLP